MCHFCCQGGSSGSISSYSNPKSVFDSEKVDFNRCFWKSILGIIDHGPKWPMFIRKKPTSDVKTVDSRSKTIEKLAFYIKIVYIFKIG